MVHDSGFLTIAPQGCTVLADRGFKCITGNRVNLEVPPSKRKNQQFTRAEISKTRQIASLRIHIERVIERLREFRLLRIRLNTNLLGIIDQVVIIAAALCNLNEKLLKS